MIDLGDFHNDVKQFDAEINVDNRSNWVPTQITRNP
jgi:hypothetical protein